MFRACMFSRFVCLFISGILGRFGEPGNKMKPSSHASSENDK